MHHFVSRVSATARGGMPARALATAFDAVVFDKDGTLLDFAATWNPAIYDAICESAGSDGQLRARIANVLGFDMALRVFRFLCSAVVALPSFLVLVKFQ